MIVSVRNDDRALRGVLVFSYLDGPEEGWCNYRCQFRQHTFTVLHFNPSGHWALIATVAGMLAEIGIGSIGDLE